MTKLEKIETDIERTRAKIAELQARLRELDGQKTEQENIGIVGAVRALNMTPAELAAFIKDGTLPASLTAAAAVPASRYARRRPEPEVSATSDTATDITKDITTESEGNENE